jgi:hypothetical protein
MDSAGLAGAPPARCRLLGLGLAAALAALIADRRPFGLAREVYEREKQTRNRRGLKFKKTKKSEKTKKRGKKQQTYNYIYI